MIRPLTLVFALVSVAALVAQLAFEEPWWSADQKAMRQVRAGDYSEAAKRFEDPLWHALCLYRAGRFEDAATSLMGVPGAEAAYNRGNALIFLGKYEDAVVSFERALELRPGWVEAEENRNIASLRIRTEKALGEATEVGADEITFDKTENKDGDSVEVTEGGELSEDAMRALWLRNVQTQPGDFLRVKFGYQRAMEQSK